MKLAYKLLPLVLAVTQTMPAIAAPASFMNARAFAMGGTGVSSARPGAAGFYNPALLSVKQEEKNDALSLFLPSINIRVAYDDNLIDKVDNIQNNDSINNINNAVTSFNSTANTNINQKITDLETVIKETNNLNSDLQSLDKISAGADIGLGTSFAMPGKTFGFGLMIDSSIKVASTVNYLDGTTLSSFTKTAQDLLNTAKTIQNGNTTAALSQLDKIIENSDKLAQSGEIQLQSNAVIFGAALSEVGISISHEFNIAGHSYAVGITPKIVRADLFNYQVDPNSFDSNNFDANDFKRSETSFNLDLGVARQFGATKAWTAGLSVRNIIPTTYNFTANKLSSVKLSAPEMKIEPQVTAGISHTGDWHTVAIDLDLTKNRAFGLEDDEQFLSVGAEFDFFDTLQLRAGFRYNVASDNSTPSALKEDAVVTAGLGLDLIVNLALSGYASSTQKGAALEMGIVF